MLKMIRNSMAVLAASFVLASCSTFDDARDALATAIETEERRNAPDRVRIVPEYIPIPPAYLGRGACPPPTMPPPEEIARMTWEGTYNEDVVAPLYSNNEQCYLNNQRIERFDMNQQALNTQSDKASRTDPDE